MQTSSKKFSYDCPPSFCYEPWGRYRISFVIAARPGQVPYVALKALRALNLSADRFEILVAYGDRPALQRNQAARQATGNFLYFIDDDTTLTKANLDCLDETLCRVGVNPDELILGGPVLLPPSAEPFEEAMARTFASRLGIGPYRFRYSAVGQPRFATERDLILANLLISRELFLKSEGFNEDLYPGEENQWLKRVMALGIRPLYDPQFACYRRQRQGYRSVFELGLSYGEGRAKHYFEHLRPMDLLLLAPSFLVLLNAMALVASSTLSWSLLALYLAVVTVASAWLSRGRRGFFCFAGIFPLLHYGYGFGFLKGLLLSKRRRPTKSIDVQLHSLKSLFHRPVFSLELTSL